MPHEDGPLYYPSVTMLSIGSDCIVTFMRKNATSDAFDVFVPSRSVIEFSGELYTEFLHGVPFRHEDQLSGAIWSEVDTLSQRSERYSCTFRNLA